MLRSLAYRTEMVERIDPSEFPVECEADRTDPSRNLNLPMWRSMLPHVRADMAAVLCQFDLCNTVLSPIRNTLPDGAGVRDDFCVLSVANLKLIVDPALSAPLKLGRKRWGPLSTSAATDDTVVAKRSALEGPDIRIGPQVATTTFVSDRLA